VTSSLALAADGAVLGAERVVEPVCEFVGPLPFAASARGGRNSPTRGKVKSALAASVNIAGIQPNKWITACASGDLTELVTQLKDDVIVYTDGGGKGAVPNPIYGIDKVTRLLLGLARKAPPGLSGGYPADVNGEPGFVFTLDGKVNAVLSLDLMEDGRIRTVFLVANPDKLPKGSISES